MSELMDLPAVGSLLAVQCVLGLPFFLIYLVAGVMVATRLQNNRTAAYLAISGCVLGVIDVAAGVASSLVTPMMVQQGGSMSNISMMLSIFGVLRAILGAVSLGLLMAGLVRALGKPRQEDAQG